MYIVSTLASAMARFTADTLETQYGDELKIPPLSDAKTPHMLGKVLLQRNPPLIVSDGIVFFFGITHIIYCIREDLPHRKVSIEFDAWPGSRTP